MKKIVHTSLVVSMVLASGTSALSKTAPAKKKATIAAASCDRGSPLDFCPSQDSSDVEATMKKEKRRHPVDAYGYVKMEKGTSKTFGFDSFQGIYLEGMGLEGRHFSVAPGSTGPTWPPDPKIGYKKGTVLVDASTCDNPVMQIVVQDDCNPPTSGHFSCRVQVVVKDNVIQGHPICGQPIGTDTGVQIVKGFWDEKGDWKFDANNPTVTLTCDTRVVEQLNQPTRADGAVARCIQYFGYTPSGDNKALTACIRMQRADYCGDGQSHTYIGSYVMAYDKNNSIEKEECGDGQCLEASWSDRGAECVNHTRWTGPGLDFYGTWCSEPNSDTKTIFKNVPGKPYRCRDHSVVNGDSFFTRSRTNTCGGNCPAPKKGVCQSDCPGGDTVSPGCQSNSVNPSKK
jgi:hypothetical protein